MPTAKVQPLGLPGPARPPGSLGQTVPGLRATSTEAGLAVSGEVDLTTWSLLSDALAKVADSLAEGQDLVLDLSELSFIDGHGVQLIARAAEELDPSRRLVLREAPQMLLRIAEILRLRESSGLVIEGQGDHGPA